jgi:HK97 family phage portal protein
MKNLLKYVAGVTRAIAGRIKSVQLAGYNTFSGIESYFDTKNMQTYKTSLYVYIGVSMIARRVAGIPLNYYKVKGSNGEVVEVLDHPVIDLMANPVPYLTQKEFFELSAMFYLLSGDVFWYLEQVPKSTKVFMHPLRPNDVEVVLNADQTTVLGYRYTTGGVHALLMPENVVHIKNIDPTNILRGVGVLAPASTRISTEQDATEYQANFFKNQGRPDVAVFIDQEMNQVQMDEARAKWKEVYGRGQGGQAGFFGKNVKEVKQLTVNPREMDFIATQNFLRDDILASLHIPKAMVTSDDVNLANAKEANKMYITEAVLPVVDAFKDAINNRLAPKFDDSLFTRYDNPVPEDRDIKLKEAVELKKGGIISANEAREMYGYAPADGADELATVSAPVATTLMYEAKQILKARPVLRKRLIAVEKTVKAVLLAKQAEVTLRKPLGVSLFKSTDTRKAYAAAVNKAVDVKADKLAPTVVKYFEGMLERILKNSTQAFSAEGFMDVAEERTQFKATVVPALIKTLEKAGQDALDALYVPTKVNTEGEEFVLTPALLAKYTERTSLLTESIVNTAHESVKSVIMQGLAAGDGVDVIGRALRDHFEEMKVWKGKQIARTETGYSQSLATQEAYKQSAIVVGKEWITAGDSDVRDEHKMNDGVIVDKNGVFPNGEEYPAQHTINCRCVIAPTLGETGL